MDLLTVLLQAATDLTPIAKMVAGLAASIAVIGASMGISAIGRSSVESIARQPEAANDIRANMILTAAFVEGVALFAVIAGILAIFASKHAPTVPDELIKQMPVFPPTFTPETTKSGLTGHAE